MQNMTCSRKLTLSIILNRVSTQWNMVVEASCLGEAAEGGSSMGSTMAQNIQPVLNWQHIYMFFLSCNVLLSGTKHKFIQQFPDLYLQHFRVTKGLHHPNFTKPWSLQIGKQFSPSICFWQILTATLQFPVFPVWSCRIPRQSPHLWLIGSFWSTKALIYSPDGPQARQQLQNGRKRKLFITQQ